MLHDDSSITMAARVYAAEIEEAVQQDSTETGHANDDFDDVFGSAPGSPTCHNHDNLGEMRDGKGNLEGNEEVSDIPRLKEKHETEGYRDGVTKGKAESVQKGFDEGYSLGATLGLRVGKTLGLIEGIYFAVRIAAKDPANSKDKDWEAQSLRLEKLWADAKAELKTQNVFGRDWWGEDGIWSFEVPGEGEGREVLFPDVAAAHPLVVKWERVVQEEVKMWDLDLRLMEHEDDGKDVEKDPKVKEEIHEKMAPGAAKELAW